MLFEDQVFIVTGGGSGIGEAIVLKLASEGASVVVGDVDDVGGHRVAEAVKADGGSAVFVHADVSLEEDAQTLVDQALLTFGRLDGAANNAGVNQLPVRIHETTTDVFDRVLGVDLRGVFFCMRAQLNHFLTAGGGVIVNTASGAALQGVATQGTYTTAKHGVLGLTRSAAIEYVRDNIRVNAVAPGLVKTEMFLSMSEEQREWISKIQPGGRPAEASEIANGIVWLLSDQASYVSGSILEINAAWSQQ